MSLSLIRLLIVAALIPLVAAAWRPVGQGADVDGDGANELILFDSSRGVWTALSTAGRTVVDAFSFGGEGRIPLAGRFFSTPSFTPALYDPSSGECIFSMGWADAQSEPLRLMTLPDAVPMAGDVDGDGRDELVCYRPTDGTWHAWAADGRPVARSVSWGFPGAIPVLGDVDGDGISDLAVVDPARGDWYLRSLRHAFRPVRVNWGRNADWYAIGDVDGDGRGDLTAHSSGLHWHVRHALTERVVFAALPFGDDYSFPAMGRFSSDPRAQVSYLTMSLGKWYVRGFDGSVKVVNEDWVAEQAR